MKVKLLARKGANKAGAVVDYDQGSAEWLIARGFAEEVKSGDSDKASDESAPAARRGRPAKEKS